MLNKTRALTILLISFVAVGVGATLATISILLQPQIVQMSVYQVTEIRTSWDSAWGTGFLVIIAFTAAAGVVAAGDWRK